jgi:hypothetical protein
MAGRKRELYSTTLPEFKISRSKIDLFVNCPRCFYLDRKLGVSQPSGPGFSLNNAVDELLKREFDSYRALKKPHPIMVRNNIDAVPFQHPELEVWRNSLRRGIAYPFPGTNLKITGGVDDVWVNPQGDLIIVDYKATSSKKEVSLDDEWKLAYKRQMEIYQWLFRRNGFSVHPVGYFVYCNGLSDAERFDAQLNFSISLLGYEGSDLWVEPTIQKIYECISADQIPAAKDTCAFCAYRNAAQRVER